jgi:hypothetical protein
MRLSFLAVIVLALALSGCATPYQKKNPIGGYSETQLGESIFRVSFEGNGYTSRERASDFALLRSAEIAIEMGTNTSWLLNRKSILTWGLKQPRRYRKRSEVLKFQETLFTAVL